MKPLNQKRSDLICGTLLLIFAVSLLPSAMRVAGRIEDATSNSISQVFRPVWHEPDYF